MTASSSTPNPATTLGGRVSVESIRRWYVDTIGALPTVVTPDPASQEVSASLVMEELLPVVSRARRHGDLPGVGTPAWRDLTPGDPRRVGAVHLAAVLWAIHQENRQHAVDEAAAHLAASGMASAAARYRRDLTEFYDSFPDLRRKAS